MVQPTALRPLERRIRRLLDEGVGEVEVAWRFRRSPRFVRQVADLADARSANLVAEPGPAAESAAGGPPSGLRPLERRVLFWRAQGFDHETLAPRFRRGPDFLRQVETLAHWKLARDGG